MQRMLLGICAAGLLFIGAGQAAAEVTAPPSFDFSTTVADEPGALERVVLGDRLSFEWWFSGAPAGIDASSRLTVYAPPAGSRSDFVTLAQMLLSAPSNDWQSVVLDVPSSLLSDEEGNRITSPTLLTFNLAYRGGSTEPETADITAYFRDLESSSEGNNEGENPVPEPSTLALLGVGLSGLLGFKIRKRKAA